MTLAELIEVLEAAKKGSAGLDRLICETAATAGAGRREGRLAGAFDREAFGGAVMELKAPSQFHAYTTSIDAALELVPEGWSWHLRALHRADRAMPPIVRAVVFNSASGMLLSSDCCEAEAESPAIGLCIAALRARASLQHPPIAPQRQDLR